MNFNKLKFLILIIFFHFKLTINQNLKCPTINSPENGFFIGGYCSNEIGSACGIKCRIGYKLYGSSFRQCKLANGKTIWTGSDSFCRINKCDNLNNSNFSQMSCDNPNHEFGTKCYFSCKQNYIYTGSPIRYCLPIGLWSGLDGKCIKTITSQTTSLSLLEMTSIKTTVFNEYYRDLSNYSISFGYSFKKVNLNIDAIKLPLTFEIWIRTNFTKNLRILNHKYKCFNISIMSNDNSSLLFGIDFYEDSNLSKKSYYYDLNKSLIKNTWLQINILHTESNFKLFINGVSEFNLEDFATVLNLKICYNSFKDKTKNEFRIDDDLVTEEFDYFQPIRGEISRVYLYNYLLDEEEILAHFYKCGFEKSSLNASNSLAFDWSNVLIDNYLKDFKLKPTTFCQNCREPDLVKYASMFYDGTKNGDVRYYNCQKSFRIIGHATSVCMIYGNWSHKTPRCQALNPVSALLKGSAKKEKLNKLNGKDKSKMIIKIESNFLKKIFISLN